MDKYEPTIGLEIHAELKTKTKMFCGSPNDPDEKHPNINVCPVCMGHPGTLPVPNEEAINKTIMVGHALNCEIAEFSKFDRKNYFYPDLPKGYQISQFDLPFCKNGYLEINGRKIGITRIHLEEDTGRLQHPEGADYSLVDFNRAGVPLMELVTEPDLKSGDDVYKFGKELQLILRYLGASDADMEKGQMRVEVNISIKLKDAKEYGTKVEIKNINSINAAARSIDYEIKRQSELLDEGKEIAQETRGWDDAGQKTFSQRIKETSADYRYFPEPDIPPLTFSKDQIEEIRLGLPELPSQRRIRFKEYGLNDAQIEVFTIAKHLGDYYERVASELDAAAKVEHLIQGSKSEEGLPGEKHLPGKLHALSANYIITEFPPLMNAKGMEIDDIEGFKIEPEAFAELMVMIFHEKLSSTAAKAVLKDMAETGLHPEHIAKEKNLLQVSDESELISIVKEIIEGNPKAVEDYKKGKQESIKFLTGQVMAKTKGKANPQIASDLIKKEIGVE
ncbi:MAG: Asp-tRNA(Asn)/Glu-tRNA(Gln) amidotransferase subunit GatB [bacterium]|nr:Asp-tRNA(Asn)/Glu-tRNA(Gln) amidotransferase subunit GatB [bacterium]